MKNGSARIRELPISRLFPNIVTVMAICFGLTAIRYALNQQWEIATTFIIISGFLDVIDGRLARFLKATSNFGAQLDSLADFVNFGVAPAMIMYLWCLNKIEVKGLGWAFVLFYSICTAIRLARFNSDLEEPNRPAWKEGFFIGVPSPVGGYLILIPLMLSFNFIEIFPPIFIGIYMAIIGILMTSRIPTFATKKLIIKKEYISFVLVFAGLFIGTIIIAPWIALPIFALSYLCSIPFSIIAYRKWNDSSKA